jgi:hypothetical protein
MKKSLLTLSVVISIFTVLALIMSYSGGASAKQYTIVWMDINQGLPKFESAVKDSLAHGWQLQGGVCMAQTPQTPEVPAKSAKNGAPAADAVAGLPGNTYYVQAMAK